MSADVELLGQGGELQSLLQAARSLRLPHAILIEGPPGSGKSTLAQRLALDLLDDGDARAALARQIEAGTHPDVHFATVPEGKQDIPIERVREVLGQLELAAFSARARVAVFDPGDRLNEQGQNALLKTLEEPGANSFLILTTTRPESLLTTVRSRMMRYRLRPLPVEAIQRELARSRPAEDASRLRELAQVADGSLGVALSLVQDPALVDLGRQLRDAAAGAAFDPHDLGAACFAGVSGREATEARARLALRMLRVELRAQLCAAVAEDGGPAYGAPALERWIASCERVLDAEADLNLHVGAEQTLLGVLLSMR